MSSRKPERILIIGLDGAGFDVIGPLLDEGRMPTLARLQQEGVSGPLASMYPPVSSIAWPSFCTGVGPGKHGVFGFQTFHPETYSQALVSSRSVAAPAIWEMLAERHAETVAFNIPVTYPPSPMQGAMATGMLTPDESAEWTHPPELKGELRAAVGPRLPCPTRRMLRMSSPSAAIERLGATVEREAELFLHLLRTRPWRLAVIVFRTSDVMQHAFLSDAVAGQRPPYELRGDAGRIIAEHYARLDLLLGKLLSATPANTTTMVMSDHGVGAVPRCFRINEWLASEGYLTWSRLPKFRQATALWRRRTFGRQLRALRVDFLARFFPRPWLEREVVTPRWAQLLRLCRGPDWPRTRAYACPVMREGIRINLKGRDAGGIVEQGSEYEALRDEIAARLEAVTDPETDEPVAESVVRREDMYVGEFAERAPDLIVVYRDGQYIPSSEPRRGGFFRSSRGLEAAQHVLNGIFIAEGPGMASGQRVDGSIIDLTPTILYLLDAPVPSHLDGRIIEDAIAPGLLEEFAPEAASAGYSPHGEGEDAEAHPEVLRRLRDLGYIE